jgi:hypothetical protein
LEYTEEGVTNWNVYEWGFWDDATKEIVAVNFNEEKWWQAMPVFHKISKEDASRELGHKLDGKNWAVDACASRRYKNLNLFENHAFIKVFFPSADGLGYCSLPLGKYAKTAPVNMKSLQGFSMLCDMSQATVSCVDENIFYTFRERAKYGFLMTPAQGSKLFNIIKRDLLAAKEGHFVYQIETENCAKWVQETLVEVLGEENVPNLYKTFFLETEGSGVIGWMMKVLRRAPKSIQPWLVTRLHLPLGAFKGSWIEKEGVKSWISLMTVSFWENGMIYFPAFLNHQLSKGHLLVKKVIAVVKATLYATFSRILNILANVNEIVSFIAQPVYLPKDLLFRSIS